MRTVQLTQHGKPAPGGEVFGRKQAMPMRYLKRVADGMLSDALATSGAVQIKGPKRCGRTATSPRQANSVVYLQDPARMAAGRLRRLRDRVDVDRMGEPSFLAVITAGTTAYRRDDGVLVVPLACLRR